MADASRENPSGSYAPSNLSGQHEVFQPAEVENLHLKIENLKAGFRQLHRAITVLGQSGIAALGLQYVDVGLIYLDIALVKRLQDPKLGYHEPVRQILSVGLQTTLERLKGGGADNHAERMLKYVQDDAPASSEGRRHVRERYLPSSYPTVNDEKQQHICAGLYDCFVGLSQFQPALATMPSISDNQDFEKIRAGVKDIRDHIKNGHRDSEQERDHLAQLASRLHVLTDRLSDFAKLDTLGRKKRDEEEELVRIQQDGVLITLMAGVAAQSVAFVIPVSSTRPYLDTITSMLLLSAIVFAVCGVLAQASAQSRITSKTALPIEYTNPRQITAIEGLVYGWSYNLTVLLTVTGLTCFAWVKLHPGKARDDYQPPFVIFVIFFIMVCIPALFALVPSIIRFTWHQYEVYSSYSERIGFDQYKRTAGDVDSQFRRIRQLPPK
ncbi:hypothetical protein A4X09_0g7312 [Tilletia walkeri]|uniref:Uncharacterized protein n=1 Tax=Tilletia walkeri TaxID=117179 RepID=A0A8X7N115_9BASI|nr:hypothetical protein A4X09_0g7312 [Tilletia walkeri]